MDILDRNIPFFICISKIILGGSVYFRRHASGPNAVNSVEDYVVLYILVLSFNMPTSSNISHIICALVHIYKSEEIVHLPMTASAHYSIHLQSRTTAAYCLISRSI